MSTLAGDLGRALGNIDAMQALYADNISWTLPATLGRIGGTHEGKDAVFAFNKISLAAYDRDAGMHTEILEEFDADGGRSVARLRVRATVKATGEGYDNQYVLIVRGADSKIVEVNEYLDTLKTMHYDGLRRYLPAIDGVEVK